MESDQCRFNCLINFKSGEERMNWIGERDIKTFGGSSIRRNNYSRKADPQKYKYRNTKLSRCYLPWRAIWKRFKQNNQNGNFLVTGEDEALTEDRLQEEFKDNTPEGSIALPTSQTTVFKGVEREEDIILPQSSFITALSSSESESAITLETKKILLERKNSNKKSKILCNIY